MRFQILQKKLALQNKSVVWGSLGLALILLGNAIFLKYNSFRCFNFYDMNIFIDGGWRICCGQKPYQDFFYLAGPVHLYLNALFFKIFGFGKTALLAHTVIVSSIVILAVYFMARKYLTVSLSALVTLLTATSFYWSTSLPWHDQTAHLWGILAIAALCWGLPFQTNRLAFVFGLLFGFLVIFSFMSKTNIGMAYALLFLIVLLVAGKRGASLGGYVLGAVSALLLMGVFFSLPLYYKDMMEFAIVKRDRFWEMVKIQRFFLNYHWIAFAIVLINTLPFWRTKKMWIILFVSFMGVVYISIFSGGIIYVANIFLWGIFMALAFIVMSQLKAMPMVVWQRKTFRISQGLLVILTIVLIAISVIQGIQLKVWSYMGEHYLGTYSLKAKPFAGWLFDEYGGKVLDALVDYVNQNVPKDETLLVLSDNTVLYGLTGRESYPGVPIMSFKKNVTPVPGRQLEQVRKRILEEPPDWIVTDLNTFLAIFSYLNIQQEFLNHYQQVRGWGIHAIFKRID